MSISFTGTGGLFTRLGKIAALLRAINLFRGTGALSVTTISGSGVTITVTTVGNHGYAVGDTVVISGSNIAGYNGTFTLATVPANNQFTITNATTGTNTSTSVSVYKNTGVGFFGTHAYIDNINAQFQTSDQDVVNSLYANRDAYDSVHSSMAFNLQSLAQQTAIVMADDDVHLSAETLQIAMPIIISQMTVGSQTVQKPTVSTTVTAGGSNHGNGVCIATAIGPNGVQMDYVFNESLTLTCTSDSQGSATLDSEPFSVVGPNAQTDETMWNWPSGSGANTTTNNIDAQKTGTNLMNNSGFETFTVSNTPDNWPISPGTAGTTVFAGGSGAAYKGSNCLQFTGNGAELTGVSQQFNVVSGGTTSILGAETIYAVNCWVKVSATPAAGVLEIALVDQSGTITTDAAGGSNSITLSLPSISMTYVPLSGFFRTPAVLPTSLKLRVRLSTALDAGKSVYIDNLSFGVPTQAYTGGPYVALFSGSAKSILNDTFTVAVGNKYDSQWQKTAERLFGMRSLGLQLPSGNSPTIADSLIS